VTGLAAARAYPGLGGFQPVLQGTSQAPLRHGVKLRKETWSSRNVQLSQSRDPEG